MIIPSSPFITCSEQCPSHADTTEQRGHEEPITFIAISHDNKWAATASEDSTIIIWSIQDGAVAHEWVAHPRAVYAVAWSPDSKQLLSAGGGQEQVLILWQIEGGVRRVAVLEGHAQDVIFCAWSPDNQELVSVSTLESTVRIWDALTYQQRRVLDCSGIRSSNVGLSSDGWRLAWTSQSLSPSPQCHVWDMFAEETLRIFHSHSSLTSTHIYRLSFDHSGRRLATAHGPMGLGEHDGHVVQIWDVQSGDVQLILPVRSPVMDICFSPEGSLFLSACRNEPVGLWDVARGQLLTTLDSFGLKTCFSPDGKYIVVAESRRTQLWDAGDTSYIGVLTEHEDVVHKMAFSPDGKTLVSGDYNGTVLIRHLSDLLQL